MKYILFSIICYLFVCTASAQNARKNDFKALFDGKTLKGWTATTDKPASFLVENGELVCRGGRAHLFYTGDIGNADFKNFELQLKIKTTANSNSGIYFHTKYQEDGWPGIGFEAQVNSTHSDPKRTGSLYGIVNIWAPKEAEDPYLAKVTENGEIYILQPKAPSTDGEWFDYYIKVQDNSIVVKVNGLTTVNWTQPEGWAKERRIGHGTVGLQAHDPTCQVYYKDIKIKILD